MNQTEDGHNLLTYSSLWLVETQRHFFRGCQHTEQLDNNQLFLREQSVDNNYWNQTANRFEIKTNKQIWKAVPTIKIFKVEIIFVSFLYRCFNIFSKTET